MVGGHYRRVAWWIAFALSTSFAIAWAFWGAVEAFHEGWFARGFTANVSGALAYLIPTAVIMIPGALSIAGYSRAGLALHLVIAIAVIWRVETYQRPAILAMLAAPLCVAGMLYLFPGPERHARKWALWAVAGLPILTALVAGSQPAYLAITRQDDGNYGTRVIDGSDGLRLAWAPQGPGWPDQPATWVEAQDACAHRSRDGRSVELDPIRIWRLPNIEEAVRSGVRHGQNAGGVWNPETRQATYRIPPNKETPLWTRYSPSMYRWTSTEMQNDPQRAYRYVWNGKASPYPKSLRIHFRCVSLPATPPN